MVLPFNTVSASRARPSGAARSTCSGTRTTPGRRAWAAYYIGSYADENASITPAAAAALGNPNYLYPIDGVDYFRIKSSIQTNAFASYKVMKQGSLFDNSTIRLGVINLTNEAPPLDSDPAGYDPSVYQSMAEGRTWSLRLTKEF